MSLYLAILISYLSSFSLQIMGNKLRILKLSSCAYEYSYLITCNMNKELKLMRATYFADKENMTMIILLVL